MELKHTPLDAAHQEAGARRVPFAGWEMPVQYSSVLAEARAVRSSCGLFDVSHMGKAVLSGPGALSSLLRLATNAADRLAVGHAQYTLFCEPSGGVIDDLIVYHIEAEGYLLVVNASNTETDLQWMREHLEPGTDLEERTAELALLALQGPEAERVLSRVTGLALGDLPSFAVRPSLPAWEGGWIARTGYTGEDGFELFVPAEGASGLWRALLACPEVTPCGLGARDILRTEAGYPLYGHELTRDRNPLEAGLGWVIRREDGYLGAEAMARMRAEGISHRLRGLRLAERAIARPGSKVTLEGEAVGEVTSGTYSPNLEASIALAYLKVSAAKPGTTVTVEGERRRQEAQVVSLPFRRFPKFAKP